jgi:hypothetical protein
VKPEFAQELAGGEDAGEHAAAEDDDGVDDDQDAEPMAAGLWRVEKR